MAREAKSRIRPAYLAVALVVVAAAAVFLIPAIFQGEKRITKVRCSGHLLSLGQIAIGYASEHDGQLPLATGEHPPAYVSLQVSVDSEPAARDPQFYICPGGDEEPAIPDATGHFVLTRKNVSYAYISEPLSTTGKAGAKRPIACDNSLDHHRTGISVLYLDSSVGWISGDELEKKYGGFEAFLRSNGLTR
jgi:hypothetical protein